MNFKLKQNLLALALLTCSATAFVGCSSSAKPATTSETNKSIAGVEKTDKYPTSTTNRDTPKDSTAMPSSDDKIGIAECDDYVAKYEACLTDKVPAASRGAFDSSIKQMRQSWKQAAANPQAKAALAGGCKQAHEASKQSMAAYSCEW